MDCEEGNEEMWDVSCGIMVRNVYSAECCKNYSLAPIILLFQDLTHNYINLCMPLATIPRQRRRRRRRRRRAWFHSAHNIPTMSINSSSRGRRIHHLWHHGDKILVRDLPIAICIAPLHHPVQLTRGEQAFNPLEISLQLLIYSTTTVIRVDELETCTPAILGISNQLDLQELGELLKRQTSTPLFSELLLTGV